MKRFNLLFSAIIVALLSASCGSQSPDTISQSTILKQVNQFLEDEAENAEYVPMQIGTFECNSDFERRLLRQLDAANIINYNVDRYVWWEKANKTVSEPYKVLRGGYWYSYYDTEYRRVLKTVYDYEDHYIVSVELTRTGRNISVKELPEPIEKVDKDMEQPEVDPSKYKWNKVNLDEEWPYIENPFIEQKENKVVEEPKEENKPIEETVVEEDIAVEEEVDIEDDGVERKDEAQYKNYKKLNLASELVFLKAYEVEAVKARNILVYDINGIRKAKAEVIVAKTNVTNVGRMIMEAEDDQREIMQAMFTYYQDKGWVLEDIDE